MTDDRIRLLLHEAIDIDRLVREYAARPQFSRVEIKEIVGDEMKNDDEVADEILALAEADDHDNAVNVAKVEELLARLGAIYETTQARGVIHAVRRAAARDEGNDERER